MRDGSCSAKHPGAEHAARTSTAVLLESRRIVLNELVGTRSSCKSGCLKVLVSQLCRARGPQIVFHTNYCTYGTHTTLNLKSVYILRDAPVPGSATVQCCNLLQPCSILANAAERRNLMKCTTFLLSASIVTLSPSRDGGALGFVLGPGLAMRRGNPTTTHDRRLMCHRHGLAGPSSSVSICDR